ASAARRAHRLILGPAVALLLLLEGNLGASVVQLGRAVKVGQEAEKKTTVGVTNPVLLAALLPGTEPAENAQNKLAEVDPSLRRMLDLQPQYAPADNRLDLPTPDPKKLDEAVTACR